jgi:predicted metal-dependent hydrolase
MPKSRNRKNHKQKVAQRNQNTQKQAQKFQQLYNEKLIEELKKYHEEYLKSSGDTENDGPIQSTDNTEL